MAATLYIPSDASAAAEAKPQGCTNFRLRKVTRVLSQRYDTEVGKCGLKTTQYSLLSHVIHLGPVRPGELAQAMRMDASTLTRNLRPLQEQGWITVGAGDDARSRTVRITPEGIVKRQEARGHWLAAQQALNDTLGVERVVALHALLDDTLALLEADAVDGAPAPAA